MTGAVTDSGLQQEHQQPSEAPTISAEQAADWAALEAGAAGAVPAPATGQVQAQQGPPPPTAEAMGVAMMLLGIVKPIACASIQGVKDAPDALWEPVAAGVAGLLDHYGLATIVSSGPWARFGLSVAPLAGFVAVAMLDAPEPEKKPESSIYQIPGQMPQPAPVKESTA